VKHSTQETAGIEQTSARDDEQPVRKHREGDREIYDLKRAGNRSHLGPLQAWKMRRSSRAFRPRVPVVRRSDDGAMKNVTDRNAKMSRRTFTNTRRRSSWTKCAARSGLA